MLLTFNFRPKTVASVAGWAAALGAVAVARHWRGRHRALTTLYREARAEVRPAPWLVASQPRPGRNLALRRQVAKAIDRGDRIEVVDGKGPWP